MRKETFIFSAFVLFSIAFAEEDYGKAVSKYKDTPTSIDEEAHWAETLRQDLPTVQQVQKRAEF